MRRLALIVLAVVALPGAAAAQTWGQPVYAAQPAPYGQPYGGPVAYGYGGYGQNDAYGSGQWTRGSSPPGRGYHDVYGYNDDRAPRGADHGRYPDRDCHCRGGAYLYDR
ncbi:MAG: hypothetical protein KKE52_14690 [Alphaproteobacteria bacterium]|nr:hypothetical protein [Alphaproteobacteria bacterium]